MTRIVLALGALLAAFVAGGFVQAWIGPTDDDLIDASRDGYRDGFASGHLNGVSAGKRAAIRAIQKPNLPDLIAKEPA